MSNYELLKLMYRDYSHYLLKRWGKYCMYCPQNKCVLCVEEKKYLNKLFKENNNESISDFK